MNTTATRTFSGPAAWLERNRGLALLLLFLGSLAVRLLTAEYMDLGGDNARRWMEVHRLLQGLGFSFWDHQTVRWSIYLPLLALMKAFGVNPALSPVLPILAASLAVVLLALIGEKLHSFRLGIAAGALGVLFPVMTQTGSQLWPGVFQYLFIAASLLCLLHWLDARRASWLVLAALAFFCAWGSNVSSIYFLPGLFLLVWLPTRDFRSLCLFGALLAALVAVEWVIFWQVSGNRMGIFGLINAAQQARQQLVTPWSEYLLNFTNFLKLRGLLPVLLVSLAACVPALRGTDQRWRALAWLYLWFVFLLTYMVSGFSPLRQAQPIGTRYWAAGASFGLLLVLRWLAGCGQRHPRSAKGLLLVLFLAFAVFSIKAIPPRNSLDQMARDHAVLAPVLAAGKPVLMRYEGWEPNFLEKALMRWFGASKRRARKTREIVLDMDRNKDRMLALNLEDVSRYPAFEKEGRLVEQEEFDYLFVPPGASENDPPAAEIVFGRKACEAAPLPAASGS